MSHSTTSIIVHGAAGRMGARICALAHRDPSFTLVAALARPGSARIGQPAAHDESRENAVIIADLGAIRADVAADVVVDFSSDDGARDAARLAMDAGAALLVGTTALSPGTLGALRDAAKKIPVLVAANTSTGIAVLADAVSRAAAALGPAYHASIVEAHHIHKKDAPSGTAIRLADAARSAGARIGDGQILAIRGGDVVGEHTVRFAGPGEYIELTHRATSRDVFALGALRAAAWLKGQAPGWWSMEDVLGFARR